MNKVGKKTKKSEFVCFRRTSSPSRPSNLDQQQQQSSQSYVLRGLTSSTTPKLRMLVRLVVLMMLLSSCEEDSAHFDIRRAKAH